MWIHHNKALYGAHYDTVGYLMVQFSSTQIRLLTWNQYFQNILNLRNIIASRLYCRMVLCKKGRICINGQPTLTGNNKHVEQDAILKK